jgi:uncharacterized SAM-binding protein YcdF (DUF218 family)
LLLAAADLWIVTDAVGPADAVAVFGGGIQDRPFAAAQYYRQGLVKKVLVSNAAGTSISGVAATEEILLKLGVPASAIEIFGTALTNTHEEVLAVRAWAEHNNGAASSCRRKSSPRAACAGCCIARLAANASPA